jgi:hypothetical protein
MKIEEKLIASDNSKAKYIGIIEFQDEKGDWHDFEILELPDRFLFGGSCNIGFIESGYMITDDCFSKDENLQELLEDLQVYYNNGAQYTNRIIFNDRM